MKLIRATEIKNQTGVSFDLIRRLTEREILCPVNKDKPYLYPPESIQIVHDYVTNSRGASVGKNYLSKYDESLEELLKGQQEILSLLSIMDQRLKNLGARKIWKF